jgi:hypothetical protein
MKRLSWKRRSIIHGSGSRIVVSVFVTGKAQAPWAQLLERNLSSAAELRIRVRVIENLSGAMAIAIGAVHYQQ